MAGSACEELRAQSAGIWDKIHEHPFLVEMAAGTLPESKFAFYVGQNLLFLPELARVAALGVAKADDEQTMNDFSRVVGNVVTLEIPKNRELLAEVTGRAEQAAPEMAPATLAYTRHLLTVAYAGSAVDILSSFTPCSWSYGELGRAFAARRPVPVPTYDRWFEFFAGEEYWASLEAGRQNLDRLCARTGPAEMARVAEIFRLSSQLEYLFWDMAYHEQAWPVS